MKICLDYDATLVDLMTPWMKWIRKTYNCTFTTRQISRFYFLSDVLGNEVSEFWKTEGCYKKVSPIEGAQEFVKKLQDTYGKENIHIVTATNKHMQDEKTNHAVTNFNVPESQIHHVREKYKLTKTLYW